MELSLEWLKNDKPVITLDKSKEPDFAGILKHLALYCRKKIAGLYNPGKIELIYNGEKLSEAQFFCGRLQENMKDV